MIAVTHQVPSELYRRGGQITFGLPHDEAGKAITLNPAKSGPGLTTSARSTSERTTANVVLRNGDPLDVKGDVKPVLLEGREVAMTSRQTALREVFRSIVVLLPGSAPAQLVLGKTAGKAVPRGCGCSSFYKGSLAMCPVAIHHQPPSATLTLCTASK